MAMDPYGWEVKEAQDLLTFLRPYEAWRAEWLLRCNLVTVQHRNGVRQKVNDPKFQLIKGEKVFVPIGVPAQGGLRDVLFHDKCLREMQGDVTARAVDFVFQAKFSDYETSMAGVLKKAHPGLVYIEASDLETFFELLKLPKYNKNLPVGTIHVIAHGSTRGNLNVGLRRQRPEHDDDVITYEGLEEAVKEITTIKAYPPLFLPPRPIDPDTKAPRPGALRIWACRIGVHATFLKKLKQALGPGIEVVSAPRFRQDAGPIGKGAGMIEFLRHEFKLLSKTELKRPALIKAFQAGDLAFEKPGPPTFHDGRAVPAQAWHKWIPQQLLPSEGKPDETEKITVTVPIQGVRAQPTLVVHFEWVKFSLRFSLVMSAVKPTGPADALAKLATHINARGAADKWSDLHPFPMSTRLGYKNFEALVNGFDWKPPEAGTAKYAFKFEGTRHEYTVYVPVMRGNDLICNFYSSDPAVPSLKMYREDDLRFFTNV